MALGNNIKKHAKKVQPKKVEKEAVENVVAEQEKPLVEAKEAKPQPAPAPKANPVELPKTSNQEDIILEDGTEMIMVFPVGQEEYAISIDMVSEVVKTPPITTIPQVPNYIKGAANIRGNVYAILDMAEKVGLGKQSKSESTNYALVIQSEEYKVALSVDQVPHTMIVSKNEFDQSSDVLVQSAQDETYIKKIIKRDHRMIIVVDILEMMSNHGVTAEL